MYCCDAWMLGVNKLPPLGSNDFSLGTIAGAGVIAGAEVSAVLDGAVVVVVVVEVGVSGAFSPLLPHAAVRPTMAMMAVPPAATVRRRTRRSEAMM